MSSKSTGSSSSTPAAKPTPLAPPFGSTIPSSKPFGSTGLTPSAFSSAFGAPSSTPSVFGASFGATTFAPTQSTSNFGGSGIGLTATVSEPPAVQNPSLPNVDEIQRLKDEIKNLQEKMKQNETTNRACVDSLIRDLDATRLQNKVALQPLQLELERKNEALEHLRHGHQLLGTSGLVEVLDKFDGLKVAIETSVELLLKHVECRSSEAFEDDLIRAKEIVAANLDSKSSDLLAEQGELGNNQWPKPHADPSFIQIILQTFIVNAVCRGVVTPVKYLMNANGAQLSYKTNLTVSEFKTSFLQTLSAIFKLGSWAIIGVEKRRQVEGSLETLFYKGQAVTKALGMLPRDRYYAEVSIVGYGTTFQSAKDSVKLWNQADRKPDDNTVLFGTMFPGLDLVISPIHSQEKSTQKQNLIRSTVVLYPSIWPISKQNSIPFQPMTETCKDGRATP